LEQNPPPSALRGGAHFDLLAPESVTFVFNAPHKPFVSLVGDFNGWDTRANIMTTDGEGLWWTTIRRPGQTRYGFYVAVDDQAHVWVGDPYATELRWDRHGPWAYLANPSSFRWTDQAWRTPALRDLVIYELNVRDFAGAWVRNRPRYGNFSRLLQRLDYLADLGVNAVELMPIQAFPGQSSWGYNPVFYFAVANVYGRPDDFKRFVDACHARGLAVILDVAFNHAWSDHPYYQSYPPMYDENGGWLENWNPFFHHTPPAINGWGGVDWDHFQPETTRYFQDVVRHWLNEYHVDGFRFDWVGGVDYDDRDPLNPSFDPYHGIAAICWAARQAKPDCILIGEYWQLDGTHPEKSAAKLVTETEMDAVWNGLFHHTLDDALNQRWAWEQQDVFRALGGYRDEGFTSAHQVINYTCSHDEVRPEHEIKFYSARHIQRPPDMSVDDLALAKAKLGLVALFTAPGVPMLYAGQEFGEDAPRTIDFLPLRWEKLTQAQHAAHLSLVKRLVRLRLTQPALRSDHVLFHDNVFSEEKLVRYRRWDDDGDVVAVALNFGDATQATTLSLPANGRWRDVVEDRLYVTHDGRVDLHLRPWQGVALMRERGER
jgi:1,4-alpha-glucan branching enzyme